MRYVDSVNLQSTSTKMQSLTVLLPSIRPKPAVQMCSTIFGALQINCVLIYVKCFKITTENSKFIMST